jgi:iron complex transport system ATP-binding protein
LIALTAAEVHTPLLLLDEPTAALDLRHQEQVPRLCRSRAHAGDAVVVVVHDLGLPAAYAHRVALLCAGRVAADGPPAEVLSERLLTEVYDQPVEVLPHPRTGALLVTPRREP